MQSIVQAIDFVSVLPMAVACVFGVVILMLEVFQRQSFSRSYIAWVAVVGFIATAYSAWLVRGAGVHSTFGGMNFLDPFVVSMTILFCVGGALTALVSSAFLENRATERGEYYALLLLSVAGMIGMVSAGDFVVFFISLEIMSIAAYALTAYLRRDAKSSEAGMKYFFLGAFASAILLYGFALIYGVTGTTNFVEVGLVLSELAQGAPVALEATAQANGALVPLANGTQAAWGMVGDVPAMPLVIFGVFLVLAALVFKIAAVPFHMWAPDAYQGAPTPAVGFLAATVKAASVGALFHITILSFGADALRVGDYGWVQIVYGIALLSMFVGNLTAAVQQNVKRMLAFSSIAHAGYILVALVAMGFSGAMSPGNGVIFYLFAYTFATVGAFGVLAYLGARGHEAERFDDLNGLGFKYPWLGIALTVFMLSSAGIPPTAGFMGKFIIFKGAIEAGVADGNALPMVVLVALGILTSVVGVYYYLRVMVHLYMKPAQREVYALENPGAKLAIAICAAATLFFGMVPGKLADATGATVDLLPLRVLVHMADEDVEASSDVPTAASALLAEQHD